MSQLKLTADGGGGTVSLKGPSSTTGNAAIELTVPGTGNATLLTSSSTTGKITQVIQTKLNTAVSVNGIASYADISGLSTTITPTSASNKILVMVQMQASTAGEAVFQLLRNSTAIGNGSAGNHDAFHGLFGNSNRSHYYDMESISFNFLDDAQDTNAHTYKVQWRNVTNVTTYLNRTAYSTTLANYSYSGASSITLMEVGA